METESKVYYKNNTVYAEVRLTFTDGRFPITTSETRYIGNDDDEVTALYALAAAYNEAAEVLHNREH